MVSAIDRAKRLLVCLLKSLATTYGVVFYQTKHIKLLHIPAKSPDLNPIESFWGWMRARLRLRDLNDLRAGRPVLGKTAYRVRVRNVLKSQKAQNVAKAKFNALKRVCQEVKKKHGAASRS